MCFQEVHKMPESNTRFFEMIDTLWSAIVHGVCMVIWRGAALSWRQHPVRQDNPGFTLHCDIPLKTKHKNEGTYGHQV